MARGKYFAKAPAALGSVTFSVGIGVLDPGTVARATELAGAAAEPPPGAT